MTKKENGKESHFPQGLKLENHFFFFLTSKVEIY